MATLYRTDGSVTDIRPKQGTDFSLEEAQALVGGYVQVLNLPNGRIALFNEEGRLKQLPVNTKATAYIQRLYLPFEVVDFLGDVVIADNTEFL